MKPQDGVPGVSTVGERPCGENRGTGQIAGLLAFRRALAFFFFFFFFFFATPLAYGGSQLVVKL